MHSVPGIDVFVFDMTVLFLFSAVRSQWKRRGSVPVPPLGRSASRQKRAIPLKLQSRLAPPPSKMTKHPTSTTNTMERRRTRTSARLAEAHAVCRSPSSLMDLNTMPFEVFEMIVGEISFVDLPNFLRVSKQILVPSLSIGTDASQLAFTGTKYALPHTMANSSDKRNLRQGMSQFPDICDSWTTDNVLKAYNNQYCENVLQSILVDSSVVILVIILCGLLSLR
jgi:hypothetical protein